MKEQIPIYVLLIAYVSLFYKVLYHFNAKGSNKISFLAFLFLRSNLFKIFIPIRQLPDDISGNKKIIKANIALYTFYCGFITVMILSAVL